MYLGFNNVTELERLLRSTADLRVAALNRSLAHYEVLQQNFLSEEALSHADRVDVAFMSPLHFAVLLNKEAIV